MPVLRTVPALLLIGLAASPAFAADQVSSNCLNKDAQRAAVASGQSVPLAQAIASIHAARRGEVVRARLCREESRLVYVLTLLPRSGKVTHAAIDAANGNVIGSR